MSSPGTGSWDESKNWMSITNDGVVGVLISGFVI
jgi:hypothetical protein